MEETKTRQKSRDRNVEGDRNTKYFQAIAKQGRRKMLIQSMEGPEGAVCST